MALHRSFVRELATPLLWHARQQKMALRLTGQDDVMQPRLRHDLRGPLIVGALAGKPAWSSVSKYASSTRRPFTTRSHPDKDVTGVEPMCPSVSVSVSVPHRPDSSPGSKQLPEQGSQRYWTLRYDRLPT
jgi:hypothetical protein